MKLEDFPTVRCLSEHYSEGENQLIPGSLFPSGVRLAHFKYSLCGLALQCRGERPWTYFFPRVVQSIFAVHPDGRSLALDALIVARCEARQTLGGILLVEVT